MQVLKTVVLSLILLVIPFTSSQVFAQEEEETSGATPASQVVTQEKEDISGVATDSDVGAPKKDVTSGAAPDSEAIVQEEDETSEASPESEVVAQEEEKTSEATPDSQVVPEEEEFSGATADSVEELPAAEAPATENAANKVTISGEITDEGTNTPLVGVRISIKGTSVTTESDSDGKFSLEAASDNVTLVFSMAGYATRKVKTAGKTTVDVALTSDALNLGTEVVVGYGTQKKSDLTGAVTSLMADEVMKVVSANVVSSMQGAAAGVYVTQSSGKPGGAGLDIQIRGLRSLTASNKPLYVIDGLPLAPGAEDVMGEINPNDIESIDILKDAASAAIYGARGANGVVIITTKKGVAGKEGARKKVKVNYNFYTGITEIAQKLDLFDGPEWLAMKTEAYRAAGLDTSKPNILDAVQMEVYKNNAWVDWQDELFKKGSQTKNDVSVSGGNENMQTMFSLGRYDEDGIFEKSEYARNSGRLNVDWKATEKFIIGTNVMLSATKANVAGGDSTIKNQGASPASGLVVSQTPAAQLYDSDGNLQLFVNDERSFGNPLYLIQESLDDNFRNRIIASAYASYEFIPGLTYKLRGGTEYQNFKYGRYQTRAYNDGGNNLAVLGSGDGRNYTVDNLLTYVKDINDANNLDVTLLYGIQNCTLDSVEVSSKDLPTDLLGYNIVHEGTEPQPTKRYSDEWALESYMGRVRYSLFETYLLTLAARVDGSSKFGANNRYGFFPSAAVAWKVDQESFMSGVTFVDQLKLRLSYGTIGNQDIPSFQSLPQAEIVNYSFGGTVVSGSNVQKFGNPNLKWETTHQFNAGLDFSIIRSLLDGSIEFYRSATNDLLLAKAISTANGDTVMYDNIGETKGIGFEANLIARVIKSKKPTGFNWNISGNFAAERIEVVSTSLLDENGDPIDDKANKWFIGESPKANYDYVFDGIVDEGETWAPNPDAKPGDIKVKDLDGDGKITPDDRDIIGSELPDWYGGATSTFQFMGFELSAFFIARRGVQRKNDILERGLDGRNNSLKVDYWTPENHSNTFMRPNANNEKPQYLTSLIYEDASYIALKNITLSYTVPESLLKKTKIIGDLQLYLQATNLKYWSNYQSYNPEASKYSYPMTRSYGFGINVGL